MGKQSKRRAGKPAVAASSNTQTAENVENTTGRAAYATAFGNGDEGHRRVLAHPDNLIPRQRYLYPEDWEVNMACIHPFARPEFEYVCIDAEKYISKQDGVSEVTHRNKAKLIQHYGSCPICFKDGTLTCGKCGTVSYCSKECQTKHWTLSHKKACKPNPNPYKFRLRLEVFRGLTEDCFEGHEFLVIKPTEKLETLQQICDQAIESADDLFEIPSFGVNQMREQWLFENRKHPVYQQMTRRFGWSSGRIGLETVYGYRPAESRFIYFCWCDDSFQSQMDLEPNYYGKGLFPPLEDGKRVRGNIVVFKQFLKNKRIVPPQQPKQFPFFLMQMTDDADLEFEFILTPMNKAELAHMLKERCRAMDKGANTTRMWRYPIRQTERQVELEKQNGDAGGSNILAF